MFSLGPLMLKRQQLDGRVADPPWRAHPVPKSSYAACYGRAGALGCSHMPSGLLGIAHAALMEDLTKAGRMSEDVKQVQMRQEPEVMRNIAVVVSKERRGPGTGSFA